MSSGPEDNSIEPRGEENSAEFNLDGDESFFLALDESGEDNIMIATARKQEALSLFARRLPLKIAEQNQAIILEIAEGSDGGAARPSTIYTVGMVVENGARLGNIAQALQASTQDIRPQKITVGEFQNLLSLAYANLKPTTGPLVTQNLSQFDTFAAVAVEAIDEEIDVPEFNLDSSSDRPRHMGDYAIQMLGQAASVGASDIHFEPGADTGRIRFRVDGIMQTIVPRVPVGRMREVINALAAMAKVRSDMIGLEPCSAAIALMLRGQSGAKRTEYRIEFTPSKAGVAATVRQNAKPITDITQVGFEPEQLEDVRRALANPQGVILVTGPTGSGKSNTLEAMLHILAASDERKIIQIGNPIEFYFPGRVQISITPKCTWEKAFNSSLRQDPDIISPGEMRTEDESKLVLNAALTGHQVLTSFHTNDIASTFTRLSQMHITPNNQADSINLIISQRLVRLLCPNCKALDRLRMGATGPREYLKVGCAACGSRGYQGRVALAEVLYVNAEIRDMIRRMQSGLTGTDIVDFAHKNHRMLLLEEVARRKIEAGVTSRSEVERVMYLTPQEPSFDSTTGFVTSAEPAAWAAQPAGVGSERYAAPLTTAPLSPDAARAGGERLSR